MMVTQSEVSRRAPEGEPALEINDLVVRYGSRRAVDGLTLRVPSGSVYGLLGANGAGKTTTIKTLLGFRAPTSGSVRVLGYDSARDRVEINARIGYVSETNSLYLGMSIAQLCDFFRSTARQWNQAAVDHYLQIFGLPSHARARQFSKGMRTQLALCLALGSEPDLLILDEPTTGLDPLARRAFLTVLVGEVAAAGKTVFFSSHILSDVEAVADHVGILRAGRLLVSDELDVLKQHNADVRLAYAEPPTDETMAALRGVPGVRRVLREGRGVRMYVQGDVAAAVAALRALSPAPAAVDTSYLSLDDIFLSYMQEGQA
ncbi:MAG: ABC transporter ATP-binding protein [Ktedonobacterales bacterium]